MAKTNKQNDMKKANALVGMSDFENMLSTISAGGNVSKQSDTGKSEEEDENGMEKVQEKTSEGKAAEMKEDAQEETNGEETAEMKEDAQEEKKQPSEEKKGKKKKSVLDDVLSTKRAANGASISLMIPVNVRDFLNVLKDMSPSNSMVNILTNIVEDFKNNHRAEIMERIKKMNEEKLNNI